MHEYLEIGIKFTIGIISLIFQMNLLGKSNLAPASTLDQLQNFVLGGIIGGVIYNTQISILQFFLVLIIWTFLVAVFKYLKENIRFIKNLIDGPPVTLIKKGKVNVNHCAKKGISASDLMFKLRASNIYDTKQVKLAILEQNGQLTIILDGEESVRFPVITNGYIDDNILDSLNKDRKWLLEEIESKNEQLSNIYLGEYINGNLQLSVYN